MNKTKELAALTRDCLAAVREGRDRSHAWRAWESVQERDSDGNAKGPLPYTEEALAAWDRAERLHPNDPALLHHLAIAHHARAWDLEIAGSPEAPEAWEKALGYWRRISARGDFWSDLKAKLLQCRPEASADVVDSLRGSLMEHLLDIHVDFVRHYFEGGEPHRAGVHVEIVRRARIAPAVRKRLKDKLFAAMTGSVGESLQSRAFESALAPVEQFLSLFEDHLPALRLHAEICKEWLSGLSYGDGWDEILTLARRARPRTERLAGHADLKAHPLAGDALQELASLFTQRGSNRGDAFFARKDEMHSEDKRRQALDAYEFSVEWGRAALPVSSPGSGPRRLLGHVLNNQAICLQSEIPQIMEADVDLETKLDTAMNTLRRVISKLEEAAEADPDDEVIPKNLDASEEALADLEKKKTLLKLNPFALFLEDDS